MVSIVCKTCGGRISIDGHEPYVVCDFSAIGTRCRWMKANRIF